MESKELKIVENEKQIGECIDYKAKALEFLKAMGNTLPDAQQLQFLEMAQAYKLNPFKREIYAVGYGDKWNVITGYEVYLKRAERIGKMDGWEATVAGKGEEMTATVTIWRKDWNHPFTHTVLFSEVCQKTKDKYTKEERLNSMWKKMPSFMCKKVAIAQAFRLCFPDEFGGMPYTSDELGYEEDSRDVTPAETKNENTKSKAKKEAIDAVDAQVVEVANPKPALKYTKEQALDIAKIVNSMNENGEPYFTDGEKTYIRNILIDGRFAEAKNEAEKALTQKKKFSANNSLDAVADKIF